MSKSSQKKRNSALLYEFLVLMISRALVEGENKKSAIALKILKKHFKPGTELYKELRLINSLARTVVSSEGVACSIIQEAKAAARSHDVVKLDKQKSFLIHCINHDINDENFYDQQVNEYRELSTIQSLLNDWRSPDCDIERVAKYEDQLVKMLTTEKTAEKDQIISGESPGESRLMMKVMMKRLNEKYSDSLNNEQKALIRAYAFSTASDDSSSIKMKLEETRDKLLSSLDSFERTHPSDAYINNKLVETRKQLMLEDMNSINDELVTRFMLYTKLASELESPDEEVGNV